MTTDNDPVLDVRPLGFPWATDDPFLFCAYHDDAYPRGNGSFGPATGLAGRAKGSDFSRKDGWSMYHGESVPGFPAHPHRGFETVTIVRCGLIDHADSLGATARFGQGDVQWLTAGQGVVHSEMFPLLAADADNPLELFQIWLNLPAASKMAAPHFTMFWADAIPRLVHADASGRRCEIACIAGALPGAVPLAPPPDSWAARPEADVAIWTLSLQAGAHWTVPPATGDGTQRRLYVFRGSGLQVAGRSVAGSSAVGLRASDAVELVNTGDAVAECLLLQGRPIGEPVVQRGPFVMNTQAEIVRTFEDYRRTGFGGWPWPDAAPVHGHGPGRFARHPDGREERPAERSPVAA